MAGYGFRIHTFLFVFQENGGHGSLVQHLHRAVAAGRDLDTITMRFESHFAKFQGFWTVVHAQQSGGIHLAHLLLDGYRLGFNALLALAHNAKKQHAWHERGMTRSFSTGIILSLRQRTRCLQKGGDPSDTRGRPVRRTISLTLL